MVLYFGCRKRDEDYLYREELEQYLADGTLSKLYLAFSRDQAEKVYVTHLLRQNKDEVWDLIGQKNGHFYICGSVPLSLSFHSLPPHSFCGCARFGNGSTIWLVPTAGSLRDACIVVLATCSALCVCSLVRSQGKFCTINEAPSSFREERFKCSIVRGEGAGLQQEFSLFECLSTGSSGALGFNCTPHNL